MLLTNKVSQFTGGFDIEFIPVDHFADAIRALSLSHHISRIGTGQSNYFHSRNLSPLPLGNLPSMASRMGRIVASVLSAKWVDEMRTKAVSEAEKVEWTIIKEYFGLGHRMISLHMEQGSHIERAMLNIAKCPLWTIGCLHSWYDKMLIQLVWAWDVFDFWKTQHLNWNKFARFLIWIKNVLELDRTIFCLWSYNVSTIHLPFSKYPATVDAAYCIGRPAVQ